MSYTLNKTDGTLLVDLIDGEVDTNSTGLALIGRNYTGYGEFLNENFIKLLENFSSSAAPENPLKGQLWYDTNDEKLKIFNGLAFENTSGAFVQSSQPSVSAAGDMWIDSFKKQMYAYDGSTWILIGPTYQYTQGETGIIPVDLIDITSKNRTVLKIMIGGELAGIISDITFTPSADYIIPELVTDTNTSGIIYTGYNIVDTTNFLFRGTALSSKALVNQAGTVVTADQFLPNNKNGLTVGTISVQNSGGVIIGLSSDTALKIASNAFNIENQLIDKDIKVRIRSSSQGGVTEDALSIKSITRRVGVFTNSPQYTFDVNGDTRITGNLIVEGDTVNVDVADLRIEDKTIELASPSNASYLTDALVDGAGIIVKSSNGDISWTWDNANTSWKSSEHINLALNRTLKIDGVEVLSDTALGSTITQAVGLVEIGTLQYLNVDSIGINGSTITGQSGINITAGGTITITDNQKITGLATPVNSSDAANKAYVDTAQLTAQIQFALDVTGFVDINAEIISVLEFMYPASTSANGKVAKLHTFQFTGTSATIDVASATNKSFIAVDSNGTQNESVVQDVNFDAALGTVDISVTRINKTFQIVGGVWTFIS